MANIFQQRNLVRPAPTARDCAVRCAPAQRTHCVEGISGEQEFGVKWLLQILSPSLPPQMSTPASTHPTERPRTCPCAGRVWYMSYTRTVLAGTGRSARSYGRAPGTLEFASSQLLIARVKCDADRRGQIDRHPVCTVQLSCSSSTCESASTAEV